MAAGFLGLLPVLQAGLLVSAAGFLLVGPIPLLARLMSNQSRRPVLWASLVTIGIGSGANFVPVLPAVLEAIEKVRPQPL
jgi:hypothetical protein